MTGPAAPQAGWADARVSGRPGTSGFSFAAPKVMVLAGQMFPPLFSLKITFSPNPRHTAVIIQKQPLLAKKNQ